MAADQETAHQVIDQIAALPELDQITFAAAEAVSTARAAYDALTEAQKAYVDSDTLAKLEALETALSQRQEQVDQVVSAIQSLPETEDPYPG